MDNLAHSLVGLAAAKAGLEKLSPAATTVCVLAANAPDIDFVAVFSGDRWTLLHHHRGFSHSILGTLLFGLFIPILFCLVEQIVVRIRGGTARLKPGGLLIASLLTVATHPILDWTNSYGVRPLLPWNGRWFYGDLVFIVDPFLWLGLGAAVFLLTSRTKRQLGFWVFLGSVLSLLVVLAIARGRGPLPVAFMFVWFAIVTGLIIARKFDLGSRFGRKLATGALVFLLSYWGGLGILHSWSWRIAKDKVDQFAAVRSEQVLRLAATPTLANPLVWRCLVETDRAVYRFDVSLTAAERTPENLVRFEKPDGNDAQITQLAKEDRRARFFFEFARFPAERIVGDCATEMLVQFADLRYTEPGPSRGSFSLELPVDCQRRTALDGR
jgi:inner membrane protein